MPPACASAVVSAPTLPAKAFTTNLSTLRSARHRWAMAEAWRLVFARPEVGEPEAERQRLQDQAANARSAREQKARRQKFEDHVGRAAPPERAVVFVLALVGAAQLLGIWAPGLSRFGHIGHVASCQQ